MRSSPTRDQFLYSVPYLNSLLFWGVNPRLLWGVNHTCFWRQSHLLWGANHTCFGAPITPVLGVNHTFKHGPRTSKFFKGQDSEKNPSFVSLVDCFNCDGFFFIKCVSDFFLFVTVLFRHRNKK